jgi:hypothetical protein
MMAQPFDFASTRRAIMVANKRYQIFVSSTQADLRNEREAIINELTKVGYIAVGMEQFPATDEEQMDFIRPVIDESDYYVVVIKGRYGSIGKDGISYTEKEFRYAVETKKPALAFLYKDVGALRVNETDNDPEKMGKLSAFRAELEQKRIVKHWLSVEELVTQVKDSLNDMVRRKPAVGWIRGDQGLDPEVYRERDELRKDNTKLKEAIIGEEAGLAVGGDIVEISFLIRVFKQTQANGNDKPQLMFPKKAKKAMTCDSLVNTITDELYRSATEEAIQERIEGRIKYEYENYRNMKSLTSRILKLS